jgi:hypothetical protein
VQSIFFKFMGVDGGEEKFKSAYWMCCILIHGCPWALLLVCALLPVPCISWKSRTLGQRIWNSVENYWELVEDCIRNLWTMLGTHWELHGNTWGVTKIRGKRKINWDLMCMLPHLIGWKILFLPTSVLCHFWSRLMAREWIKSVYYLDLCMGCTYWYQVILLSNHRI